jgi:beta-galactosidase
LLNCTPAQGARQRAKPFLLCEYAHAMGNGPGALDEYEELTVRFPRLHGGFVWEWRDHGIQSSSPSGQPFYAYGGDFGEVVHDGNFVMDGMVLSNDVPTPGLYEYKAVTQPIQFTFSPAELSLVNRRHSADTSDLVFRWQLAEDGRPVSSGNLAVPVIAAGSSARVPLPSLPVAPDGETWLTVDAVLALDEPWAPAGHVVATAQHDLSSVRAPDFSVRPSGGQPADGTLTLGRAEFVGGHLVRLGDRPVTGPRVELFRAPTDNDEGTSGSIAESDASQAGVSNATLWRRAGLDRLTTRLVSVSVAPNALRTTSRVAAAHSGSSVTVETIWTLVGDELDLRVEIAPSRGWSTVWPRIGIRFDLPADVDGASWFGRGPLESYPDSAVAAQVGRFSAAIGDLSVDYARPQETGHRADLRSLTLTAAGDDVLTVRAIPDNRGRRPGFTLTRHTPQEIARAAHPYELPPSTTSYLFIDAAQHGLGSRACGPDVRPGFALRPEARTIHLRLG